jgi:hypothetical protein
VQTAGKSKFFGSMAIAIILSAAASTTASAAVRSTPSPSSATRPAIVRPLTPSECQGTPSAPNNATESGTQYIELHTWTECFGTVAEITSYLELQKWVLLYPGTGNTEGEWEAVAGPVSKNFPGVTSTKEYQYASVKCSAVGGSGKYRTVAWATWEDTTGLTGTTDTAYSSAATLC